jgi:hypothetical protein
VTEAPPGWTDPAGDRRRALGRTLVGVGALGLVVVVTVLASSLGDDPDPSGVGGVDLQLRAVLEVAEPAAADYGGLIPACTPGPVCADDVPPSKEVVLADALGARYRLAPASFTAADVGDARPEEQPDGSWGVVVRLRPDASEAFTRLTTEAAAQSPPRDRIAIVVGGALVSAPTVREPISLGTFVIVGDLDAASAASLAAGLAS